MAYLAGAPIQNFTQPQLVWATPAQGSNTIAVKHTVGCAWLMQRGVFLQGGGVDYTEDQNGFYLTTITADGIEAFGVLLLSPLNISNMLSATSPVINAGGLQFADGTVQGTAAIGRNRVINGDFRINQRNVSSAPAGAVTYVRDRWYVYAGGSAVGVNTWGNPNIYSGVGSSIAMSGAAGNTSANCGQRLEAANIMDLAGKTVTLSAWLYRTSGGNVSVPAWTPASKDNWSSGATNVLLGIVTLAPATWTFVRYSFTMALAAINGFAIEFDVAGLPAGDNVGIADVQLEAGNNLYPIFERRDLSEELRRCQRYYETSYDLGVVPGSVANNGMVQNYLSIGGVNGVTLPAIFKQTKRAVPAVTWFSPTTGASGKFHDNAGNLDCAASTTAGGMTSAFCTGPLSPVPAYINCTGQWAADAEL